MPLAEEIAKYPRRSDRSSSAAEGPSNKRRKLETSDNFIDNKSAVKIDPKDAALNITEQFIVDKLRVGEATGLVMDGLPRIGSTMPSHFASSYTPIAEAGTQSQIRHVARLLAAQMTNIGIGPGVDQIGYVPKRVNNELCSLKLPDF